MAKSSSKNKKPTPRAPERTTGLMVALAIVIVWNLIMTGVYWSTQRQADNSSLVLTLLILASAASVVAGIGMWYWKRWGILVYAGAAVVSAVVALLLTGSLTMMIGAIIPPIIVGYILRPSLQHFK
jgi:phosphatidylserine synthase